MSIAKGDVCIEGCGLQQRFSRNAQYESTSARVNLAHYVMAALHPTSPKFKTLTVFATLGIYLYH